MTEAQIPDHEQHEGVANEAAPLIFFAEGELRALLTRPSDVCRWSIVTGDLEAIAKMQAGQYPEDTAEYLIAEIEFDGDWVWFKDENDDLLPPTQEAQDFAMSTLGGALADFEQTNDVRGLAALFGNRFTLEELYQATIVITGSEIPVHRFKFNARNKYNVYKTDETKINPKSGAKVAVYSHPHLANAGEPFQEQAKEPKGAQTVNVIPLPDTSVSAIYRYDPTLAGSRNTIDLNPNDFIALQQVYLWGKEQSVRPRATTPQEAQLVRRALSELASNEFSDLLDADPEMKLRYEELNVEANRFRLDEEDRYGRQGVIQEETAEYL